MNLKELKSMIAEEYKNYMAEQAAPGVAVADTDVDAMGGGEDAEATLRDIYEMLKSYFEGDAGAAGAGEDIAADDEVEGDAADDVADYDGGEADDDSDDGEALQERFKKLANIIKG